MLKVKILTVGKTKESWLEEAIQEYSTRLKGVIEIEFLITKDDKTLLNLAEKEDHLILMDPAGREFTSEAFSKFLFQMFEKAHSRLCIVIGGAEGIPPSLKAKGELISLSKLTFTHQIARLILVEQIYRAHEINRGSSYHK